MKKTVVLLTVLLCAALLCGCMTMEGFYDNNGADAATDAATASGSFVATLRQRSAGSAEGAALWRAVEGASLMYDEANPLYLIQVDDATQKIAVKASDVEFFDFKPWDEAANEAATCRMRVRYSGLTVGKTYQLGLDDCKLMFKATPESDVIYETLSIESGLAFTVVAEANPAPVTVGGEIAPQVFETPAPAAEDPAPTPDEPAEDVDVDEPTEEEPVEEPGDDMTASPWPEGEPFDEAFGVDPEQNVPRTGDAAAPWIVVAAALFAALLALGCGWKKAAK